MYGMAKGDGGDTDNGMKPASTPYTPCGSKEADSERKFDISTDALDTTPHPTTNERMAALRKRCELVGMEQMDR